MTGGRRTAIVASAAAVAVTAAVVAYIVTSRPPAQSKPDSTSANHAPDTSPRHQQPAVHGGDAAWASLNPHATALRAAATSYAKRFATQWWAYDASDAGPNRFVPDDVLGRVAPFLDERALGQASDRTASSQAWAQIVANRQRAVPFDLDAYVPAVWDTALAGADRKQIPPGAVMVTVTGSTHVFWNGGKSTNTGLAITVDVRCHQPAHPTGAPSCMIDYLFPRVAR